MIQHNLSALKDFANKRPPLERCELCAAGLPDTHEHLYDPAQRRLKCACPACAQLFCGAVGQGWRRVTPRAQRLAGFGLDDALWASLQLPIDLCYFQRTGRGGELVAYFPSPAGATQSLLPADAWAQLRARNPELAELEPDVEALLVNRVGEARAAYRVSVDVCFELVGLVRSRWRGLSGGSEAWTALRAFFERLEARGA